MDFNKHKMTFNENYLKDKTNLIKKLHNIDKSSLDYKIMTQKQEELQRKTFIVEKIKAESLKNESNPDN